MATTFLRSCFCMLVGTLLHAHGELGPANASLLTYEVDLRLAPGERWTAALEDFISKRGTAAFHMFFSSVLAGMQNAAGEVLSYYREHIHEFMAAYAKHLPDEYGEMLSLADVLSAHASTPDEKQLFSRESVFLAQVHMEIMSIAPSKNSSVAAGIPKSGECTSVVVQRPGHSLLHFRNWDFGPEPKALGTASVLVDFVDGQGDKFRCLMALTHIAKLTTCLRPSAFSMSLNAREYGIGYERGRAPFEQLQLLQEGHLPRIGVLRKVMLSSTYKDALNAAKTTPAMTSLYVILGSGEASGGGAIVTIMGNTSSTNTLSLLDGSERDSWFLVQTNVDHWLPMSAKYLSSHRREHVKARLRQLGPNASKEALFKVLQDASVFPAGNTDIDDGRILRPSTIASVIMEPSKPASVMPESWEAIVWQSLAEERESASSLLV